MSNLQGMLKSVIYCASELKGRKTQGIWPFLFHTEGPPGYFNSQYAVFTLRI